MDKVPGTTINHIPASTRCYVGSPAIEVLPGGSYVAAHDVFGSGATNDTTHVFRSDDRGAGWQRVATLNGQVWSNLFCRGSALYIFGTDHCDRYGGRLNGRIVIRRSMDGGKTWTAPTDAGSGLLTDEEGWHCAPMPVVTHANRVWRAFEFAPKPDRRFWEASVISAPTHANPLDRRSWTFSEPMAHRWSQSQWIEGNMVVTPEGRMVDFLRTNYRGDAWDESHVDVAAIVRVDDVGKHTWHNRATDIFPFPGGGTKFTLRRDAQTGRYFALVNRQKDPPSWRNRLYLASSADLHDWTVHELLLEHPDRDHHAFQYVDWQFDDADIVYASRTAYDDGLGGTHRAHDANFLTFHRIVGFRDRL